MVEIMVAVVIIGVLAALAVPGFQKIHSASQDKAVLNNAQQLASAADQYFSEYGVSTVTLGNLIGPTRYIKALNVLANETYPAAFTHARAITITGIGGLRTITYAP